MRARRALVPLAAAGLIAAAAVPALAHTELVSSGPKKGSVRTHLPRTVILNFSEPLQKVTAGSLILKGSNRAVRVRLNPRNASQVRITTRGDAQGRYTAKVTLLAPDGDTQVVSYSFRVRR